METYLIPPRTATLGVEVLTPKIIGVRAIFSGGGTTKFSGPPRKFGPPTPHQKEKKMKKKSAKSLKIQVILYHLQNLSELKTIVVFFWTTPTVKILKTFSSTYAFAIPILFFNLMKIGRETNKLMHFYGQKRLKQNVFLFFQVPRPKIF